LFAALLTVVVAATQPPVSRVAIPGGSYLPLYATTAHAPVHVSGFLMDREPVTREDYLRFVIAREAWRRGGSASAQSEAGYLNDWRTPTDPGAGTLAIPVTDVSRNAAAAYCAWRGGRLPTTNEWEYVAAASSTRRDAAENPATARRLLAIYSARAGHPVEPVRPAPPNAFGISHLHDLIWEWTASDASAAPEEEHMACAAASSGATDPSNYAAFLRYAFRSGLGDRSTVHTLGFRCVSSL
jgi:formylglycine-generating enzyme